MRSTIVTIGLLIAFAANQAFPQPAINASKSSSTSPGQEFVIGISPYLKKEVKDEVFRGLVRLLVEDLPPRSGLTIFDAFELKTITRVALPEGRVFNSPKTRANQFTPAIRDLKFFLAEDHARPTNNSNLKFDDAIRLPQFLDFLNDHLAATNSQCTILLVGSPLYQDAKEPGFSMVDGYFPSDGHLRATREKSIYGFSPETQAPTPATVYWMYFADPWLNDLHKEMVTRFWTLYLERRGAQLAFLTSDLPSALRGLGQSAESRTASKRYTVDASQTKIEMLRINRNVEVADWLTRDNVQHAMQPPSTMIGPMKIGIRWTANIDLDLYSTPRTGAETLFFEHLRSSDGYYYKDHRSSPGKEYEFIEFDTPVDCREVEAFVNFYKGHCPDGPRGEVRIEFDGRIYGGTFSLRAEDGNLGRSGRSQQDFWTRIPIQEMLKLAASNRAG